MAVTYTGGGANLSPYHGVETVGTMAPSGCTNVDAWRNKYTALGFLAYRWHHTKRWCYSNYRINSVSIGYYVSDNNGFNVFQGHAGEATYYYTYYGGIPKSGHYSMRQATMQNCYYSCFGTEYPWVSISARGDGGWSYSAGG